MTTTTVTYTKDGKKKAVYKDGEKVKTYEAGKDSSPSRLRKTSKGGYVEDPKMVSSADGNITVTPREKLSNEEIIEQNQKLLADIEEKRQTALERNNLEQYRRYSQQYNDIARQSNKAIKEENEKIYRARATADFANLYADKNPFKAQEIIERSGVADKIRSTNTNPSRSPNVQPSSNGERFIYDKKTDLWFDTQARDQPNRLELPDREASRLKFADMSTSDRVKYFLQNRKDIEKQAVADIGVSSSRLQEQSKTYMNTNQDIKGVSYFAGAFALGAAETSFYMVSQPLEYAKDNVRFLANPGQGVSDLLYSIQNEPARTLGGLAPQVALWEVGGRYVGKTVKNVREARFETRLETGRAYDTTYNFNPQEGTAPIGKDGVILSGRQTQIYNEPAPPQVAYLQVTQDGVPIVDMRGVASETPFPLPDRSPRLPGYSPRAPASRQIGAPNPNVRSESSLKPYDYSIQTNLPRPVEMRQTTAYTYRIDDPIKRTTLESGKTEISYTPPYQEVLRRERIIQEDAMRGTEKTGSQRDLTQLNMVSKPLDSVFISVKQGKKGFSLEGLPANRLYAVPPGGELFLVGEQVARYVFDKFDEGRSVRPPTPEVTRSSPEVAPRVREYLGQGSGAGAIFTESADNIRSIQNNNVQNQPGVAQRTPLDQARSPAYSTDAAIREGYDYVQSPRIDQTPKTSSKTGQSIDTVQEPVVTPAPPAQVYENILEPPRPTPRTPVTQQPRIPPPLATTRRLPEQPQRRNNKLLEVFIRRGGKDQSIGSYAPGQARNIFLRQIKTTLAASGFVRERDTGRKLSLSQLGLSRQTFTTGKKDPFRIVEKREERLSTRSERKEIGLAKRARSIFGGRK